MNHHPARQKLSAARVRGLALMGSALILLTTFCLRLASSNRAAWRSVLDPGPASVDQALAAICGSLALAIALWLLAALLLSLLATLGSRAPGLGAASTRAASALAPTMLRNAVAALLGVAIATAPAAAHANARDATSVSAPARGAQAFVPEGLSPAWAPTGGDGEAITSSPTEATPPPLTTRPTAPRTAAAGPTNTTSRTSPISPSSPTSVPTVPRVPSSPSAVAVGPTTGNIPSATPTSTPRIDVFPGWIPQRPPSTQRPGGEPSGSGRAGSDRAGTDQGGTAGAGTDQGNSRRSAASSPKRPPSEPFPIAAPGRRANFDQDDEITVRRGDTLWGVAERHLGPGATNAEIALEWPHWFTANRTVIGDDPDRLVPGERLRPPERDGHTGRHRVGVRPGATAEPKARSGADIKADVQSRGAR